MDAVKPLSLVLKLSQSTKACDWSCNVIVEYSFTELLLIALTMIMSLCLRSIIPTQHPGPASVYVSHSSEVAAP